MAKAYLMQARDSSSGALTTWLSQNRDFAGADYPGPGTPIDPTVLRAAGSDGGGTGLAGIGTIASPGTLRGIIGASSDTAYHIGGFWSLADDGGGSFFWDPACTDDDDTAFTIRPTAIGAGDPGRWRRIWSHAVSVDWFGAKGDATWANADDGTNDHDAIQAAINWCATHGHRLVFNPKRVYRCNSPLDVSGTKGLVLDGLGGWRYDRGASIKFTGAFGGNGRDSLIQAYSALGFRVTGMHFNLSRVTLAAADLTYANAAARLGATLTTADLGKVAQDTDTGLRWRLTAVPSTWQSDNGISVIDSRHTNWNGIGGAEGGDAGDLVIEHSIFASTASQVVKRGVRLSQTLDSEVYHCNFTYLMEGVTGTDTDYGAGYSNVITVSRCTFDKSGTAGITQPHESWKIEDNNFEPKKDGTTDGVLANALPSYGLTCLNNWHGDGSNGIAYQLSGCHGVVLKGNKLFAGGAATFADLTGVSGLESGGNYIQSTTAYRVHSGSTSYALKLGPDYWTGTLANYFNYDSLAARDVNVHFSNASGTVGGLMFGDGNNITGFGAVAVGRNCTAANESAAFGFACTAAAVGLTTGNSGVGRNDGDRVIGGGTLNGSAGSSQATDNVWVGSIATMATTALKNSSQANPCATLTNSHSYSIRALVKITNLSAGIHVTHELLCDVSRNSLGTVTINGQSVVSSLDPGATGITATFAVDGGGAGVNITVTNPSASTVHATAYVSMAESV